MPSRPASRRYAALLRGVNLGPHKRVKMADLRALVEELGCENVRTYLQSGNVVFASSDKPAALVEGLEAGIEARLGLDVTVVVRSAAQLAKILRGNPFSDVAPDSRTYVAFLAARPAAGKVRELDADDFSPDEFHVAGENVYLCCPNGYGRSKLGNAHFERKLGVAATTRNWRTVEALAELTGG